MKEPSPVCASERLQHVFARDERLIDIIAGHSPQLAKLRNSPIRRIMARVTTVAQAARLCGISAETLVAELNEALGIDAAIGGDVSAASPSSVSPVNEAANAELAARPEWSLGGAVELDVRESLRAGQEPFSRIMETVASLEDGQLLRLRTTFEPVPLFAVLSKRGFAHHAERHGPEDWLVYFRRLGSRAERGEAQKVASVLSPCEQEVEAGVLELRLDVRGLEPPEPMTRTLEALESLPATHVLLHVNVRVPQLLLPILRERGFDYSIDESTPRVVYVRIWRNSMEQ